jgi:hypothetical protein
LGVEERNGKMKLLNAGEKRYELSKIVMRRVRNTERQWIRKLEDMLNGISAGYKYSMR